MTDEIVRSEEDRLRADIAAKWGETARSLEVAFARHRGLWSHAEHRAVCGCGRRSNGWGEHDAHLVDVALGTLGLEHVAERGHLPGDYRAWFYGDVDCWLAGDIEHREALYRLSGASEVDRG